MKQSYDIEELEGIITEYDAYQERTADSNKIPKLTLIEYMRVREWFYIEVDHDKDDESIVNMKPEEPDMSDYHRYVKYCNDAGMTVLSYEEWTHPKTVHTKAEKAAPSESKIKWMYDQYVKECIKEGYVPRPLNTWEAMGMPTFKVDAGLGIKPTIVTGDDAKALKFARAMHEEFVTHVNSDLISFAEWIDNEVDISDNEKPFKSYAIHIHNNWHTNLTMSYTDFSRKQPKFKDSPFKEVDLSMIGKPVADGEPRKRASTIRRAYNEYVQQCERVGAQPNVYDVWIKDYNTKRTDDGL